MYLCVFVSLHTGRWSVVKITSTNLLTTEDYFSSGAIRLFIFM